MYRSSYDGKLRRIFSEAKPFVTPYAATGSDEFVAEAIRSMLSANDEASFWPKASPARLKSLCPEMYEWVEEAFAEMEAATGKAQTLPAMQVA